MIRWMASLGKRGKLVPLTTSFTFHNRRWPAPASPRKSEPKISLCSTPYSRGLGTPGSAGSGRAAGRWCRRTGGVLADQHGTPVSQGWPMCEMIIPQVRTGDGDVLQQDRVELQRPGCRTNDVPWCQLIGMPSSGLLEQRQMLRIGRVEVLVDRPQLSPRGPRWLTQCSSCSTQAGSLRSTEHQPHEAVGVLARIEPPPPASR